MILIDLILGFALLLTIVILITGISHVFVGAPYVPTPPWVMRGMLEAAALRGTETIWDLGAGDGRFLAAAKREYPALTARGCEIVPTVWLLGKARLWWSGEDVELRLGNALLQDVSDADVVFLYLTPSLMDKLAPRFDAMLRPGTLVLSHAFRFTGREPAFVREVRRGRRVKKVFGYRW